MTKYAIILPAGSGKTTIAHKFKGVYDIDQFQTTDLKQSCIDALKTNNWIKHHILEYNMIHTQIKELPLHSIILLHSVEKALLFNLIPLSILKINKKTMLEVAEKRKHIDGEWRKKVTILNWENTKKATICDTYEEIEIIIKSYIDKIRK